MVAMTNRQKLIDSSVEDEDSHDYGDFDDDYDSEDEDDTYDEDNSENEVEETNVSSDGIPSIPSENSRSLLICLNVSKPQTNKPSCLLK